MPASRQTLSWRGCASLALALLVFATPFAASAHHNGGALEARGDMGLEEEAMLHPREVAILKSALERRAKSSMEHQSPSSVNGGGHSNPEKSPKKQQSTAAQGVCSGLQGVCPGSGPPNRALLAEPQLGGRTPKSAGPRSGRQTPDGGKNTKPGKGRNEAQRQAKWGGCSGAPGVCPGSGGPMSAYPLALRMLRRSLEYGDASFHYQKRDAGEHGRNSGNKGPLSNKWAMKHHMGEYAVDGPALRIRAVEHPPSGHRSGQQHAPGQPVRLPPMRIGYTNPPGNAD